MASAFRALVQVRDGAGHAVVVGGPSMAEESWVRETILLVWLSLPLTDRYSVYFSTAGVDLRGASPLLTADAGAWDRGAGRIVVEPGRPPLMEDRCGAWARAVFDGKDAYARVSRRVDSRGWSLLASEGAPVVPNPVPSGGEAFRRWFADEVRGLGRGGGLGRATARVLEGASPEERSETAEWLLTDAPIPEDGRFWDGLVRGILTWDRTGIASPQEARLAVRAGFASSRRERGLELAVRGLETLIRGGLGLQELVASVEAVTRSEGEVSGVEMWRLGFGLLRRWGRVGDLPVYLEVLPPTGPARGGIADDVADFLVEAPPAQEGWERAMSVLWSRLVGSADPGDDRLHRLAWEEHGKLGGTALARLARGGDTDALRFARAFLAKDPPLPVFLELREATGGAGKALRGGGG